MGHQQEFQPQANLASCIKKESKFIDICLVDDVFPTYVDPNIVTLIFHWFLFNLQF